jgi:hypothetical protein
LPSMEEGDRPTWKTSWGWWAHMALGEGGRVHEENLNLNLNMSGGPLGGATGRSDSGHHLAAKHQRQASWLALLVGPAAAAT